MTRFALLSLFLATLSACPDSDQPGGPDCGDNVCSAGETHASCPEDCAAGPGSGSGSSSPSSCGNGVCDSAESSQSCPADCDATLVIENQSAWVVGYLYVWPCGNQNVGPNQLSEPIAVDGKATLVNIPPACYNVGAVNSDDTELWSSSEQDLTAGTWTWTLTTADAQAPN